MARAHEVPSTIGKAVTDGLTPRVGSDIVVNDRARSSPLERVHAEMASFCPNNAIQPNIVLSLDKTTFSILQGGKS